MINGFYFELGNKELFIISDGQNKTDNLARKIIKWLCATSHKPTEVLEKALNDKPTLQDIKRRTQKATLDFITTDSGYEYTTIKGKDFSFSYSKEDFAHVKVM